MEDKMIVEVVVYNIQSALAAELGGADRIELCDNPGEGGTSPSIGTVEVVRRHVTLDVYVMLRPRGGDFFYSSDEFYAMKRDLYNAQKLSVDGFVCGILNANGTIDKKRCREIVDKARPLKVTCHRAFDMTPDPFQALEDCIEVGFERILTSGQRPDVSSGSDLIAELVKKAAGRIRIMPGAGVNEDTVGDLIRKTSAGEIHFSATTFLESKMNYRNEAISTMGSSQGSEFKLRTVDPERVRKIRALAEAARVK